MNCSDHLFIIQNYNLIMYLKVHYGEEIHLLNKKVSFEDLESFIRSSFKDLPQSLQLIYLDSDGDRISLYNQDDLATLYETGNQGYTKVYVNQSGYKTLTNFTISQQTLNQKFANDFKNKQTQICKQRDQDQKYVGVSFSNILKQNSHKVSEQKRQQFCLQKTSIDQQSKQDRLTIQGKPRYTSNQQFENKDSSNTIRKPEQIKNFSLTKENMKKINGEEHLNLSEFIMQTVNQFLPILTEKVKKALLRERTEQFSNIHKVRCDYCLKEQIRGIRYECSTCTSFNLCSYCENEVVHPHNLIKIKKPKLSSQKEKKQHVKNKIFSQKKQTKIQQFQKSKPQYKQKQQELDPQILRIIILSVKEVAGDTKQVQEFARKNIDLGVDKIIDMWFTRR